MKDPDYNYGAEEWRAPTLQDGDEVLFSECGRVVKGGTYGHDPRTGIDYRSHYFRIVKSSSRCLLLVKHGGGEERIEIDYSANRARQFFEPLDSTQRYLLMHMLYNVHGKARREASEKTASEYRRAFIDGRIKKRKYPAQGLVKVWIESKPIEEEKPPC